MSRNLGVVSGRLRELMTRKRPAVLGPAGSQHAAHGNLLLLIEEQDLVIQDIGKRDRRLPVHLRHDLILQKRFLSGDLLEKGLPARLIKVFKLIEAIMALAHQLTGLET